MKKRIVLAALFLFAVQGSLVKADQLSELKQQMEQQNMLLQQMQQKLAQLEAQQVQQEQRVEQQITKAVEQKKIEALPESMKWVENIKWSGDLRYRHEQFDDTDAGT